ncbi:HK97 family phage prohead protease [Rhizobium laguerreae]|uniref:HK97 family phage prohead protease n=1 Tax=Rhizobium laguerreae TaxID=1076926 RepID=UPI00143FAA8B|nr:HK97 family phage prohead protease [Rhizobium laguerreae]
MSNKRCINCGGLQTRDALTGDTADFEVRFGDVGETGEIEGTAVRWNVTDTYRTQFAPTAFAMAGRSIPMLWSHRSDEVIGSWSGIVASQDGLTAKGKLNLEIAKAREVRAMLKAGDVSGLSIGFSTVKDERGANGIRRITEARLHEISIVAFPSVPGSGITRVRNSQTGHASAMAFIDAVNKATRSFKGN